MAKPRRLVPFEDFGIEFLPFAASHRIQKVSEVAFGLAFKRADQFSLQIEERMARNNAFGSE